jgi:predicted RNase H-like nuclease
VAHNEVVIFIGVDLAWGEGTPGKPPNKTGLLTLGQDGTVLEAALTEGIEQTLGWNERAAVNHVLAFIDAPLIVTNPTGQRLCETHVGQRYWKWKVSANSTNSKTPWLAGVALLRRLTDSGWRYSDGREGPQLAGRVVSECYPYTTLVGVAELGYEDERPLYKRKPKNMRTDEWRPLRASVCDDLIRRMVLLADADPPLNLRSHALTRRLVDEPSPLADVPYKERQDLIDAALCAWTAALWTRWGDVRCQVLGVPPDGAGQSLLATIIAPARPEQRI